MHACPHCNQPGISVLRRAFLGPAIPATCVACGRDVGVPWGKSLIALSPFLASRVFTPLLSSGPLAVAAVVVGAGATFALFYLCVPLVPR
jgi:hypothetical protein